MEKHKNPGYRFGKTKRLRDLSDSSQMIHHGELISAYAKFCHARVIVEIGVQRGNTTSYLCEAASLTGGKVYGYDFFPEGEETIGAYDKEDQKYPMEPVKQKLINEGHSPSLFKLRKIDSQSPEFLDVLKKDIGWYNWDNDKGRHREGGLIDLAFIDGCHSYAGAKNDFINIYPLLARDGSIFFHDTFSHVGLRKLVLDLYEELNDGTYDIINLPYGHGKKRVGVTILTKRSYPMSWKPDPRDWKKGGIINTEHDKDINLLSVYEAEHQWYLEQLEKNKKEE